MKGKERSAIKIRASLVHRDENGEIVEERDLGTSTLSLDQFREEVLEK